MGVFDELASDPIVADASNSIHFAESEEGVELTSMAREVVTLLIVSPAFDSPFTDERVDQSGLAFAQQLAAQLPRYLSQVRDSLLTQPRPLGWQSRVTTPDVYHWLAKRARLEIRRGWPYPKEG